MLLDEDEEWENEFRAFLEEYTQSNNLLKEIHLVKQVDWDYDNLQIALESIVRAAGYRDTVKITFDTKGNKVSAYASGKLSEAAQNKWVKIFCFLSCLWLVFAPIYFLFRKRIKDKLFVSYPMEKTEAQFYQSNYHQIYNSVCNRVKGRTLQSA